MRNAFRKKIEHQQSLELDPTQLSQRTRMRNAFRKKIDQHKPKSTGMSQEQRMQAAFKRKLD